jgi:hypothetical protein
VIAIQTYAVSRPRLTRLLERIGRRLGAPVVSQCQFDALRDSAWHMNEERTAAKQFARRMSRQRIAERMRDWIHERPDLTRCNMSADTCEDWPLAHELAGVALGERE